MEHGLRSSRYSEPAALPWAGIRSAVAAPRVRAPGRRSAPATPPSGARCSSWSVLCLTSPLNSVRRAAGRGGLPRGRTPTSVSPQSPPRTPALCGTLPALDAPLGHAGQHPRTDLVSRGACQPHPKGLLQAEGRESHQVQQKKTVFVFVGKPGLRKPLSGSVYRAPATVPPKPSRQCRSEKLLSRWLSHPDGTTSSLAHGPLCGPDTRRRLGAGSSPEAPGRSQREAAGARGAQRTPPALPLYRQHSPRSPPNADL